MFFILLFLFIIILSILLFIYNLFLIKKINKLSFENYWLLTDNDYLRKEKEKYDNYV